MKWEGILFPAISADWLFIWLVYWQFCTFSEIFIIVCVLAPATADSVLVVQDKANAKAQKA